LPAQDHLELKEILHHRTDNGCGICHIGTPHMTESKPSLSGIRLFAKLPKAALAQIESQCSWRRYEPGESIVDYLDKSNDVFFIIEGEARVTIYSLVGKAVSFRDLGPGEMFGEYPAIDMGTRSASVEAKTSCLAASMSASDFQTLLRSEPEVAETLIRQLVATIRRLTTRVYEFSTLAVNNRIQAELLRQASLVPRDSKGTHVVPAPTHQEIASRVSTHREAVTRELTRLSKIGILERRDDTLLIKDIDRLASLVHEATGE
jgi:CRP/FNR family cyclic AMP-dependent transcriptional regulator